MIWKVIGAAFGLGFAAVGVGESGLGERMSLALSQPEGCPEGGCRVGYRLEDGGIRPEGWEPYDTDDPVVALMDACLTYFMTGSLEGVIAQVDYSTSEHLYLTTPLGAGRLHLLNWPIGQYGTFMCDNSFLHSPEALGDVLAWAEFRFEQNSYWVLQRSHGEPGMSEHWHRIFRSHELGAWVRVASNFTRHTDGFIGTRFDLTADYFGPDFELPGAMPDIVF